MQVQDLVGIVPWTFIAQICNLFIQVYLIKRFLFKPINEMLEKRRQMADAQIQDAVKAKNEADAIKAEYEKNMLEAKNKANDILISAQKTAAVQSEAMLKEAASQAAAIKVKAENDIAQEKRQAAAHLRRRLLPRQTAADDGYCPPCRQDGNDAYGGRRGEDILDGVCRGGDIGI